MGIRFDTTISLYILALPILILISTLFFSKIPKLVSRFILYFSLTIYTVAFFICSADVPYFNQFFTRLTVSALDWMDSPGFVLKMIIQEIKYWWMVIPFSLTIYFFGKLLKKFTIEFETEEIKKIC